MNEEIMSINNLDLTLSLLKVEFTKMYPNKFILL